MGAGDNGAYDREEHHRDHQNSTRRSFSSLGVCEELAKACTSLGWEEPTRIQEEAIPLALEGRDIIALAQTGSGKTAAFALPILQALLDKPQPFFACALSPTRELAIQIGKHFEVLGSSIGVKCAVVIGGVDIMSEAIALARRPHILVGTPGRLAYHLSNTKGFSLRTLQYFVLDEADRLLDMDFEKEIDEILKYIPKERKTFLFSATMTKKVAKLQRACLKSPAKVEVSSKYCTVETLRQEYMFVPSAQKDCCLAFILHELAGNTTMVFTRECKATRRLSLVLRYLGLGVIPISGQMSQAKRLGSLNKFRSGECGVLICTDVASRGLDIPNVSLVINYNVPEYPKDYVHRVGRTARAGKSGRAITIVTQYDIESFLRIENAIGIKLSAFKAELDEMVMFQSSVSDAQRIAIKHMHEKDDRSEHQHRRQERDNKGIMMKYTAKKKKHV